MPEEVLFEQEQSMPRDEIADYLRTVADRLDAGTAITFAAGAESIEVTVPARPVFEIKVERETSTGTDRGELSVEFELEWDETQDGSGADGDLRIE